MPLDDHKHTQVSSFQGVTDVFSQDQQSLSGTLMVYLLGCLPLGGRTRLELVILRLEIQIVHTTHEVPGNLQFALDERLIDDHLCSDVGQFRLPPELDLLAHRLEIPLHPVQADRDRSDPGHKQEGTSSALPWMDLTPSVAWTDTDLIRP